MIILKKNKLRIINHSLALSLLTLVLFYVDFKLFILSLTFLILFMVFCFISRLEKYRQGLYFSFLSFESYINSERVLERRLPFYTYYWDNKAFPIHLSFREH